MTFTIAKFDGQSYGERYCPFDLPQNQVCEDLEDAREKAIFAFEDGGVRCTKVGAADFETDAGEDYRVFVSE